MANNQTNVFAILSLIFAFVFTPLGLVFGIIALSQIKQDPRQEGHGLALAGVIISSIFIFLFIVMLFFMMAVFSFNPPAY